MPQFERHSLADAGFFEIFLSKKQHQLRQNQNKNSLLLKIAIFFGLPVLADSIWLWKDSDSEPTKLSWLMLPFVILFYSLRVVLTTSINLLKLVTELGPYYLKELTKAYHVRVVEKSGTFSSMTKELFLSELLLRISAGLFLLGRATTSPIDAMKDMSEIGAKLGKGNGKYAETALWFLFGFLSLSVSAAIYTFVLPFAIQAVVVHFPVAASSAATFFASNFPNLVSMSIAASPIIMAGVEAFGAIVLGLILFTDMATFLVQQRMLSKKEKQEALRQANNGSHPSLEEGEYLLVEDNINSEDNEFDGPHAGSSQPFFPPAPKEKPSPAQNPKTRSFCGFC